MTDGVFDAFQRAALVVGSGSLQLDAVQRIALVVGDGSLMLDGLTREALVSFTTSTNATALILDDIVREVLVADPVAAAGVSQTAVSVIG